MADPTDRVPQNVPGRFYVDASCIDCDLCRSVAPEVFRRHDESGFSYVHHQPDSPEQEALAQEAIDSCPVNAIGDDGEAANAA